MATHVPIMHNNNWIRSLLSYYQLHVYTKVHVKGLVDSLLKQETLFNDHQCSKTKKQQKMNPQFVQFVYHHHECVSSKLLAQTMITPSPYAIGTLRKQSLNDDPALGYMNNHNTLAS